MNREIDLSKTGYFDYLIKNDRVKDPGEGYGPTPHSKFSDGALDKMRRAFIIEYSVKMEGA